MALIVFEHFTGHARAVNPAPPFWHTRGYLPHFDDGTALQCITYRLADALPHDVAIRLAACAEKEPRKRAEIEGLLDSGFGQCHLREPANADAVVRSWKRMHCIDYLLHAWVVMPNHVHVLIQPAAEHRISSIVAAWKSVSARSILGRMSSAAEGGRAPLKRRIWQPDYFDRFIRNEHHYRSITDYIHQNPVHAGLVKRAEDWPWSSASSIPTV